MPRHEPVWVLEDSVRIIHTRQISEHGGLAGARDQGMLESALGKPKNLYAYSSRKPSLARLAASYAFGIAKNHPFTDGNKRTALVVCELFLRLNKHTIAAGHGEKYTTFLALADGTISEENFTNWLDEHLVKRLEIGAKSKLKNQSSKRQN